MDDDNYKDLSNIRLERAKELLEDAKLLIDKKSFMSANNRAYYALEKACNSLLISDRILSKSHRGVINQFNKYFVNDDEKPFDIDDYKAIARAETIRSKSDYDDYFIANKADTIRLIESAEQFINKVEKYLSGKN